MADALEKRKHEVYILTTRKTGNSALNVISLPHAEHIPEKLMKLGNKFLDYLLVSSFKKILRNNYPDLLHIQDEFILSAAVHVAKEFGIPVVSTMRDNLKLPPAVAEELPPGVPWLIRKRNRAIIEHYKKVDAVISVSEYIRKELAEVGVPRDKITTIYNLPPPWRPTENSKTSSNIVLLAPGRICKYKGFEVLAKATSLAVKKCENIRVIIAGKGSYYSELRRLVGRLNLTDYMKLVGVVPYEEIKELYFNSDIVVFPSIYPEPLGRVSIEAMVAGKPVIASAVGGIPEIVDNGVTGILVPPDDPEALAGAIVSLAMNENLRRKIGRKGREFIFKKLNPDVIVEQHLQIYRSVRAE